MREQQYLEGFIQFEHARKGCDALDRSAHAKSSLEWSRHREANIPDPQWRDRHTEALSLAIRAFIGEDALSGVTEWILSSSIALGETCQSIRASGELLRASGELLPRATLRNDPRVAALEERVRKLEALIENLVAKQLAERRAAYEEQKAPHEEEEEEDDAVIQPHARWIEANQDKLQAYPNSFVALDVENGIVAHATDGDDFEHQLNRLPAEQRDRVILFHTSMYAR